MLWYLKSYTSLLCFHYLYCKLEEASFVLFPRIDVVELINGGIFDCKFAISIWFSKSRGLGWSNMTTLAARQDSIIWHYIARGRNVICSIPLIFTKNFIYVVGSIFISAILNSIVDYHIINLAIIYIIISKYLHFCNCWFVDMTISNS